MSVELGLILGFLLNINIDDVKEKLMDKLPSNDGRKENIAIKILRKRWMKNKGEGSTTSDIFKNLREFNNYLKTEEGKKELEKEKETVFIEDIDEDIIFRREIKVFETD